MNRGDNIPPTHFTGVESMAFKVKRAIHSKAIHHVYHWLELTQTVNQKVLICTYYVAASVLASDH